jgi:hypothetical protein
MHPKHQIIAAMIKDQRIKKKLTLRAAARLAKMQASQLKNIEAAKVSMTLPTAVRIFQALDIQITLP